MRQLNNSEKGSLGPTRFLGVEKGKKNQRAKRVERGLAKEGETAARSPSSNFSLAVSSGF